MSPRLSGAAVTLGVLLLDPITGVHYGAPGLDDARLERLSVPTIEPRRALFPIESAASEIGRYDVPLNRDHQHLIVEGTLNGMVTGPMLIDTGASYCVLTRATARKLGIRSRSKRTIPVATANGQVRADLVEVEAVQLRNASLVDVDAVIMDAVEPPLIGIIGLNFLTQFRFSVDLTQGTLRLEP